MLTRTLPQSLAALLAAFTSCFTAPPCTLRYLLVHPAGVTRDAAIEALWSELDPDRGVAWFKAVLGNLRRALRPPNPATSPPSLGSSTATRQANPDVIRCDLWRFQHALTNAAATDPAAKSTSKPATLSTPST